MPDITVPGGASAPELRAHLAAPPATPGPWPGVVVLHELFGLNDDIREQAERLAAAGYLALAPDLFTSGGLGRCGPRGFPGLLSGGRPAGGRPPPPRAHPARPPRSPGQGGRVRL